MESGVVAEIGEDEAHLFEACGVIAPTQRYIAPLAPHLAARRQGITIDGGGMVKMLVELCERWPIVVLELAGGWFSPFDERLDNAEWLAALPAPQRQAIHTVLVAPDRLGVLHDVSAACRAAASLQLGPSAILLSSTALPDASSGDNASELAARSLTRRLPIFTLPRGSSSELAGSPAIAAIAELLLAGTR
jgi:dethiobiotin synthetase